LWLTSGLEMGPVGAHICGMNRYHAIVSVDSPDGVHKRVSLLAESLGDAQRLFAAQYGEGKVVSVWGEYEGAAHRDK
jgi:hypothetical protein